MDLIIRSSRLVKKLAAIKFSLTAKSGRTARDLSKLIIGQPNLGQPELTYVVVSRGKLKQDGTYE